MASPAVLQKLSEAADIGQEAFKKKVLKELPPLEDIKVTKNYVLVAVYIGGKYIAGTKILASDNQTKEYVWQAQVGFIVKCGPTAFKTKDGQDEPDRPYDGEWALFTAGDGKRVQINGVDLRYIHEDVILGTAPDPARVTWRN